MKRVLQFALLVLGAFLLRPAGAYEAEEKVMARQGTMPVILTVPHDGTETLGWMRARSKGARVRDLGTRDLAERTAVMIEKQTGQRPYLVIAKFSRQYLDANRAEADAMESDEALPAYRAYHGHIARFVAEVAQRYPGGALLVDVHGQSDEPATIFRGTRNGLTVGALVRKHGRDAVQGPDSILGVLQAKGYRMNPAVEADGLAEDKRFNGGHTVFSYGSNAANGIDAIQLEFGSRYRGEPALAGDLAVAIVEFARKFLAFPR